MAELNLNPSVDSRDAVALREQNLSILALLRLRPRTNIELAHISLKYTSRISELRQAGYDIRAARTSGRVFTYTLISESNIDVTCARTDHNDAAPAADEVRTSEHSSANSAGRIGDGSGGSIHTEPVACVEDVGKDQRDDRAGEKVGPSTDDRGRAGIVLGRWEDALTGIAEVEAVICDPPYSARVHEGNGTAQRWGIGAYGGGSGYDDSERRAISYAHWTAADVRAFVGAWAPRNRGWFVCLSDNELCGAYREAFEANGLTGFAPVGILIPGMTVRMAGDGPSSWMLYANVARPKKLSKWGTLPGGYTGPPGERVHIGGKALWLMRALVRDYTKPGDLVCDPCAGAASTLVAAVQEGRRCIGAEVDPETWKIGAHRLATALSMPSLFSAPTAPVTQGSLFGGGQ